MVAMDTQSTPLNISISQAASERMRTFLEKRGKGIGIRLGVQTSGCSGMSYLIEFVDELTEGDEVIHTGDVDVIVNQKAALYLQGLSVDFQREGLNEGFKFVNPNAKAECGCGESFTI